MESISRYHKLKSWVGWLEEIQTEFPGSNVNLNTAIKSFKSQLKELETNNEKNSKSIKT